MGHRVVALRVDEPVAGMTPQETERTAELLVSLAGTHSVVVVEHDLDVALRVVERCSVMHNGAIFKEGTPEEIRADPEVRQIYLGGGHG